MPELRKLSVIGGGTGSFHLLSGLRPLEGLDIRSIVTMMDDGGDSGRLRDEYGVLPPGDLRRCLIALSEESSLLRDLFSFRFEEPPLEGRHFGNLLFLALTQALGSERAAVDGMGRLLKIRGRAYPVTWDDARLFAELEDGTVVEGEANIDVPKHDPAVPIRRAYLEPPASANPDAMRSLLESDHVVLAPGDLYTSTVANLLVEGVPDALQQSRAPLTYVVNLTTKYGETHGYSASHHVAVIARHAGRVPDGVLVHRDPLPQTLLERYQAEGAEQVRVDEAELRDLGVSVVKHADVGSTRSLARHDPDKTAAALMELLDELDAAGVARTRPRGTASP